MRHVFTYQWNPEPIRSESMHIEMQRMLMGLGAVTITAESFRALCVDTVVEACVLHLQVSNGGLLGYVGCLMLVFTHIYMLMMMLI